MNYIKQAPTSYTQANNACFVSPRSICQSAKRMVGLENGRQGPTFHPDSSDPGRFSVVEKQKSLTHATSHR